MQILTRTDECFQKLCMPVVDEHGGIEVTEDSIKICWEPSPMEEVVTGWTKLQVESYDLIIHPAERRTVTVAKGNSKKLQYQYENLKGRIIFKTGAVHKI